MIRRFFGRKAHLFPHSVCFFRSRFMGKFYMYFLFSRKPLETLHQPEPGQIYRSVNQLNIYFVFASYVTALEILILSLFFALPSSASIGSHTSDGDESDSSSHNNQNLSEMQAPPNPNPQAHFPTNQTNVPSRQTVIVEPEKLYPPQPERVWLISPPSSPPLHWQQIQRAKK